VIHQQADTSSTVSMIDKEALKNLLRENVNFAMRITAKNLSYKHMRGKLASALLYLSQPEILEEEAFSASNPQGYRRFCLHFGQKRREVPQRVRKRRYS